MTELNPNPLTHREVVCYMGHYSNAEKARLERVQCRFESDVTYAASG